MIPLHKILSIKPLEDYVLLAEFADGCKLYDLKPLISETEQFVDLTRIPGLYKTAKVDIGGYGVVWNDMLDLSAETIYQGGVKITA